MSKDPKKRQRGINRFLCLKSDIVWDTFTAQLMEKICTLSKPTDPGALLLTNFDVLFQIPRQVQQPLTLDNEETYDYLLERALKAKDPVVNIVAAPKGREVGFLSCSGKFSYISNQRKNKENDSDNSGSGEEGKKSKKNKGKKSKVRISFASICACSDWMSLSRPPKKTFFRETLRSTSRLAKYEPGGHVIQMTAVIFAGYLAMTRSTSCLGMVI